MVNEDKYVVEYYNRIVDEILQIGWEGIVLKHHPDISSHPRAMELFDVYRQIYLNIKAISKADVTMYQKGKKHE